LTRDMVALLQSVIECKWWDGDGSTVGEELLHDPGVGVAQDGRAALVAEHPGAPVDHAMPLASLGSPHLSFCSQAETLLGAALGLHFGHFASFS
jgi:hypothetical protein